MYLSVVIVTKQSS